MQVNRYNFLRWFNDQVDPNLPELPYAYHRDKGACGYMPIAPPAEAMNFYINSPVGFDYEDFPNLRLGMYRADGTLVAPSLGPLQQLELGDGTYHIYCSLVVPAAEYGIHYFRIYPLLPDISKFNRGGVTKEFLRACPDRYGRSIRFHNLLPLQARPLFLQYVLRRIARVLPAVSVKSFGSG